MSPDTLHEHHISSVYMFYSINSIKAHNKGRPCHDCNHSEVRLSAPSWPAVFRPRQAFKFAIPHPHAGHAPCHKAGTRVHQGLADHVPALP